MREDKSFLIQAIRQPLDFILHCQLTHPPRRNALHSVIGSGHLPDDGSGKHRLVLLDPGQIIYTGMETATLKSSEAGTIEMSDTPTGDGTTSTGAELVSLFQCNAVAVAAMIEANWERQREAAVVLLEEIN